MFLDVSRVRRVVRASREEVVVDEREAMVDWTSVLGEREREWGEGIVSEIIVSTSVELVGVVVVVVVVVVVGLGVGVIEKSCVVDCVVCGGCMCDCVY